MDKIKDYDDEGFELQFEDGTTAEERKYFVQTYTNINMVADRRLHCTCCDTHIGTAPSTEKIIRMHPIMRVTQCVKCYRFYNSGEFEKGEDGSELYCRWCGQGGDVYCCSDCPYVFCKKCILRNLTKVALKDVTSNDNWKCFSCAPKIIYHLRAQHWALVNFISKQKKNIEKTKGKRDQDEIADAMNHDSSQCCQSRKRSIDIKKKRSIIAVDSDGDSEDSNWSSKKRSRKKPPSVINDSNSDVDSTDLNERSAKRAKTEKSVSGEKEVLKEVAKEVEKEVSTPSTPSASKKPSPPAKADVPKPSTPKASQPLRKAPQPAPAPVATIPETAEPDLFAFLLNNSVEPTHGVTEQSENSVSSSTGATTQVASTSKSQPPQSSSKKTTNPIRSQNVSGVQAAAADISATANREQFVRRVARSQVTQAASQPVYHNYNGYRIDLNSAAQQSTIRLPNGKVIHVKKQSPLTTGRNEPTRYSITTQSQSVRPVMAQSAVQSIAPPPPRPHIIQRVPTTSMTSGQTLYPPPRPSMFHRIQSVRSQAPPPLVINSVSSAVSMPPLQQLTQQQQQQNQQQRPRVQGPRAQNHMSFQQAQMHFQQILQAPNPNVAPNAPVPGPTASIAALPPQPRVYSNDQVGRARTQLERQIYSAISICHQIDGKLKTLMCSNAYKNVEKLHDIKELYIHLSYLFTYTNGRFQSVHDKCMEDMRRLGFKNDASSLSLGNVIDKYGSDVDDDDLEIVEPNHQTINLDSDDERTPEKNKSKTNNANNGKSTPRPPFVIPDVSQLNQNEKNDDEIDPGVMLDITSSTENVECDVDIASLLQINMNVEDDDVGESLLCRMNEEVGIATPPETEQSEMINIANDLKLNSHATINLKPVEEVYPDLMEKALEKIRENETIEKEQDELAKDDTPILEEPPTIDSPDQSLNEGNVEANDIEKVSESNTTEVNNSANDNESIDKQQEEPQQNDDEPQTVPQCENEPNEAPVVQLVDNELDTFLNEVEVSTESKTNEVEIITETLIESTENSKKDADSTENVAKSIDCSDEDETNASTRESHAEITSTSTVNGNDVEISEIVDEANVEMSEIVDEANVEIAEIVDEATVEMSEIVDEANVEMSEIVDEANVEIAEIVDDANVEMSEIVTIADDKSDDEVGHDSTAFFTAENTVGEIEIPQEILETESTFSDLSDCNQLVNDEIANAIDTSDTLNNVVASILNDDDFENISSPDTFI